MARNIIVTCGTSQIEGEKLDIISRYVISRYAKRGFCDRAENIRKASKEGIKDACFRDFIDETTKDGAYCKEMADILAAQWHAIDECIGKKGNPFGAEIYTLCLLGKQFDAQGYPLDAREDRVVLLYSQTEPGAFCAAIFHHLICQKMEFAPFAITPKLLKGVTEDPAEPEVALQYIVHHAADSYESGFENLFIVTGGYKYMTDTVGLVAQLANLPHYYMFELSESVIDLTFYEELIPRSDKLWSNLVDVREGRKHKQSVPFIFRHPEEQDLNEFGKVLCETWKPGKSTLERSLQG